MDLGSAGAIASFAYAGALRAGAGPAQALQQAFQSASGAGADAAILFGSATSNDAAFLSASFQSALNTAGLALARETGQTSAFVQGLLASSAQSTPAGILGEGSHGGLEALNPQVSGALAAYQYQAAVNGGTERAYLQQLLGPPGVNLLG